MTVPELMLGFKVPPLKLNVAVPGFPVCVALLAVLILLTCSVPPFKLTVPTLPAVLPAALREMSSVAQATSVLAPLMVRVPVPRLARKSVPPPLDDPELFQRFKVPPLTVMALTLAELLFAA